MIEISKLMKKVKIKPVQLWRITVALGGINLEIDEGEFVAIMGPSGCGKTTLLNILGLLDNPSEGSYLLNGTEVAHLKESQRTALRKGKSASCSRASTSSTSSLWSRTWSCH